MKKTILFTLLTFFALNYSMLTPPQEDKQRRKWPKQIGEVLRAPKEVDSLERIIIKYLKEKAEQGFLQRTDYEQLPPHLIKQIEGPIVTNSRRKRLEGLFNDVTDNLFLELNKKE